MSEKKNCTEKIFLIDQKIASLRTELKEVKEELLAHYYKLLNEGIDTR